MYKKSFRKTKINGIENGMIGLHSELNNNPSSTNKNASSSSSTRKQALNAVEYYNQNVLRARMEAGLAGTRNFSGGSAMKGESMYRSNSSLELLDVGKSDNSFMNLSGPLRREYGSHSSIDIISDKTPTTAAAKGENFFAMLQEYRPAVLNIRNNKEMPSKRDQIEIVHKNHMNVIENSSNYDDQIDTVTSSPKLRMKLKLWGQTKASKSQSQIISEDDVNGVNLRCNESNSNSASNSANASTVSTFSSDIEERTRRRAFAHFDSQSLTANLGYAAKVRGLLLARRRNTTTGASAAAMYSRSSTPDRDNCDDDLDERFGNDLIENCPFFRNEVGGEEEREVSLTRMNQTVSKKHIRRAIHRPLSTYGVSILECNVGETLWSKQACPYQSNTNYIEQVDSGAHYYRKYFFGQEHQNWFGMDEHLGPVAISIRKEKPIYQPISSEYSNEQYLYRLIVRTSELLTLRGCVFEESIPNPRGLGKPLNTKDVIDYVAPEVQISCLRLAFNTPQCEQQLLKLDEQGLTNKYKIGILYCRAGQQTEEDMYNNEEAGPAFNEFLETIGKKVRLKGFENYKGGLDNKTDSTGTHSIYTTYQSCEIMFHVSTMLPFTPNNRQQLLRKRHIGNDIVTIVFQEPGALPFTPKNIRSQFQHVFIIVRVVNSCSDNTTYRVAVSRSKEVPVFGPPIKANACYQKNKHFVEFLLSKVINAENAAHRSEKFATMATRTRQEYLKDLCNNFSSQTPVETSQKLKIFPSKKREPTKPRFKGDACQRGAFCWQVVLHDSGQSTQIECFLGISAETFVLIEESTRQTIFAAPNRSILGWSTNGNALRVYHHQGECITMNMRDYGDRDEQLEVIERLRAVSNGCGALELVLHRNSMGQLGFHVQPDGIVTQVEINGQAWAAGLRQGYRLVEICKVAVATLSHDQMVDLLKTSIQVFVTVIESFSDFSPRRGCFLPSCKFNSINYQYENDFPQKQQQQQQHASQSQSQQRRYVERSFSPPKSVDTGYGTASSSRSYLGNAERRFVPDTMGTLTSSSSGHSSTDEKWYDVVENPNLQITSTDYEQSSRYSKRNNAVSLHHTKPTPIQETSLYTKPNIEFLEHPPTRKPSTELAPNVLMKNLQLDSNNSNMTKSPVKATYSSPIKDSNTQPSYSEDELEKIINNKDDAPQLKRSATTNAIYVVKKAQTATVASTSSSSSSRNNSPRPAVETRLKAGVNRNINPSHRSSIHCTSTFKEDLLKLINPDYLMGSSDDNFHDGEIVSSIKGERKSQLNSHSLGNLSMSCQSSPLKTAMIHHDDSLLAKSSGNKLRLKDEKELSGSDTRLKFQNSNSVSPDEEIIITTARPATVISSINENELAQNTTNLLHIKEDQIKSTVRDHYYTGSGSSNDENGHSKITATKMPNLSEMKEAEWKSLMSSAAKSIQINGHQDSIYDELNALTSEPLTVNQFLYNTHTASNCNSPLSNSGGGSSCSSVNNAMGLTENLSVALPELQSQVSQLSDRVMRETRRRRSLEVAVKRLTEENRRLQDESQQAVQQLKRFTEWFFQTIDKQ
ncbi:hypothetical protein PVAND_007357 [Polypedilum vanderplanki]|uniref:Signal-induced proliferation-associated 1-like protein 2 n=1 Tax=Polypedilum vanderplanki TaxID=319348 RepID=A0A9J6C6M3_POLVA|nr:hypothetical protein PVAND_007357 [Polypedilum vanderplanki]